jgi:hypothetical protein
MLSAHGAAVLLLTAVALYLFSRERLPIETSSLLILGLLAIGFSIFPGSSGFGVGDFDGVDGLEAL